MQCAIVPGFCRSGDFYLRKCSIFDVCMNLLSELMNPLMSELNAHTSRMNTLASWLKHTQVELTAHMSKSLFAGHEYRNMMTQTYYF